MSNINNHNTSSAGSNSLHSPHGSAAKMPFQDEESAKINCTPLEDPRKDIVDEPVLETSEPEGPILSQTSEGRQKFKDHKLPPIGMQGYSPYMLPMMIPQYEYGYPGQYPDLLMDQMTYGGQFRSPRYGFSDYESYRSHSRSNSPGRKHRQYAHKRDEPRNTSSNSSHWSQGQPIPPETLTNANDFNLWMNKFAIFLEQYGRQDIIPDKGGNVAREPTPYEARWMESFFLRHVPKEHYPTWVKQGLDKGMSILKIIMYGFKSEDVKEDDFQALEDLMSYTYDDKLDPKVYFAMVEDSITKLEEAGNVFTEAFKCRLLTRGLRGKYANIHSDLNSGKIEEKMICVFRELQSMYSSQERNKRHVSEKHTVQIKIKCSICQGRDHVAKYCDKRIPTMKPESKMNRKKETDSKQPPIKKSWKRENKVHHVDENQLTEDEEEPESISQGKFEDKLRLPEIPY